MLLADAGLRVLVVDRADEGSDTISGHMIKPDGVREAGLLGNPSDLLATGCPPMPAAEVVIACSALTRATWPPGAPSPMAPRRSILDELLQAHARRAGARVRSGTAFRSWRNGVVTLGEEEMVRTRLLVGADGRRSAVARACAAPYADLRPGRSCAWYGYWDRSPLTELRAELRHGVFAGPFPTHRAQVLAFVQLPVTAWRPGREQDLLAGLWRALPQRCGRAGGRCAVGPGNRRPRPAQSFSPVACWSPLGPWSVTPHITRIRWPRAESLTRCSVPGCWRTMSCGAGKTTWTRPSAATQRS